MRLGELLGVRWEDIDLDAPSIRVSRSFAKGKHMGAPKSAAGSPIISLPGLTVEALWAYSQRQRFEAKALG